MDESEARGLLSEALYEIEADIDGIFEHLEPGLRFGSTAYDERGDGPTCQGLPGACLPGRYSTRKTETGAGSSVSAPLAQLRSDEGMPHTSTAVGTLPCFVRPLGGPLGRQALVELASLASDTRIVAITPSGGAQIRSWLQRRPAPFPVVSDADGALAKIWGMGRDPLALYTLRGSSQGHLPGRRIWAGLRGALGSSAGRAGHHRPSSDQCGRSRTSLMTP